MPITLRIPFQDADMSYIQLDDCGFDHIDLPSEVSDEDLQGEIHFTHILPLGNNDSSQFSLKRNNQLARGFAMMLVRDEIKGPFLFRDISGRGFFQSQIALFEDEDIKRLNARFPWLLRPYEGEPITTPEVNKSNMATWHHNTKWIPQNKILRKFCEDQGLFAPKNPYINLNHD